jgi:hypothetical protein
MIYFLIRQIRSFYFHLASYLSTVRGYIGAWGNPSIPIQSNFSFGQNVSLRATVGG